MDGRPAACSRQFQPSSSWKHHPMTARRGVERRRRGKWPHSSAAAHGSPMTSASACSCRTRVSNNWISWQSDAAESAANARLLGKGLAAGYLVVQAAGRSCRSRGYGGSGMKRSQAKPTSQHQKNTLLVEVKPGLAGNQKAETGQMANTTPYDDGVLWKWATGTEAVVASPTRGVAGRQSKPPPMKVTAGPGSGSACWKRRRCLSRWWVAS